MKYVAFALIAALAGSTSAGESSKSKANWPQWRGPLGTGAAVDANPPIEWSPAKNIRWKTALPGKGHATPIVWGDRVFVTTASPVGDALKPRFSTAPGTHDGVPVTHRHEFAVLALSRKNGKELWRRTVHKTLPHEGGHYTGSLASSSPVTDGEHVYAFFGTHGLYCLTVDGELKWSRELGEMQTKHGHGEGASPVLYGETLVVNWDHEGESFVSALDKRTGEPRWKVKRDEKTSWSSPIVVEHNRKPQLIVNGTNRILSYDLATGKIIWECGGLSNNIVASPVAGDGLVFAGSSYEKKAILAIRLDGAEKDITGTGHVVWSRTRATPYVPSPLLVGDSLYYLAHYQGIISRVNARSGDDQPGLLRLPGIGDVYASPVAASSRVYITDLDGATIVLSDEDSPRVLAVNRLNDRFSASAAIVGGELYLRGERNLYCIAVD